MGICSIDKNCFVFKLFFINYGSIKPFDFVNLCLIIYHMTGLLNNTGYHEYVTHTMILDRNYEHVISKSGQRCSTEQRCIPETAAKLFI